MTLKKLSQGKREVAIQLSEEKAFQGGWKRMRKGPQAMPGWPFRE